MKSPHPTRWLWWLALIISAGASIIVYSIKQDQGNINGQEDIQRVIMFAVVGVGICVISATARWWINR